jgi:hypothetical protein
MYAFLKEWMKQVTSVIGAAGGLATITATLMHSVTVQHAISFGVMSLVMLILKDNTNANTIGAQVTKGVFELTDEYLAGRNGQSAGIITKVGTDPTAKAIALCILASGVALLTLSACSTTGTTAALASPAGQLFCAVDAAGGGQLVVGVIDAEATAKLGAAAPVAVLATGAAASTVQSECNQAALANGGTAGMPVSPPSTSVPNVAIKVPATS